MYIRTRCSISFLFQRILPKAARGGLNAQTHALPRVLCPSAAPKRRLPGRGSQAVFISGESGAGKTETANTRRPRPLPSHCRSAVHCSAWPHSRRAPAADHPALLGPREPVPRRRRGSGAGAAGGPAGGAEPPPGGPRCVFPESSFRIVVMSLRCSAMFYVSIFFFQSRGRNV